MARPRTGIATLLFVAISLVAWTGGRACATTSIMIIGDSITHGHLGHASFRYPLWFLLTGAGHDVDFVGRQDDIASGEPDPDQYPLYDDGFDRDHEGYWGLRTGQMVDVVAEAVVANPPDVALIHLGTNDIGQLGPSGITRADENLRTIVGLIRDARPAAVIVLAQIIPIGEGTGYSVYAGLVPPFNLMVAGLAGDLSTPQSPVLVIDHFSGYDLATMMQADGLHPNALGEQQMATTWQAALEVVLPPVGVGAPPAGSGPQLAIWPNPANPRATIGVDAPDQGPVSVTVFDAGGRRLRTLLDRGGWPGGALRLTWDGLDASGRPAPTGVYLVRLRTGDVARTERLTLVR
jgi:lysophospholipase L1-like esterase